MNEQKSRTLRSQSLNKSPQRRVSFSKPWTATKWPSKHRAQDKANPVPRSSRPILAKPSAKLDQSQSSKGVNETNKHRVFKPLRDLVQKSNESVKIKKHDAYSSTTVDARRRSSSDPTPNHLKYGRFRSFSKLRKQSGSINISPPSSPKRRSLEIKPILVARSNISRQESPKITEDSVKKSIAIAPMSPPPRARSTPFPPRPQTKHVNLSRTEPIHLDIKPKRFPSMLWC